MGIKLIIAALLISLFALTNTAFASKYYNRRLCSDSEYTCIKVKRGDSWNKLFPDATTQRIIRRINRMNIELSAGMMIAIPKDLEKNDPLAFSPLPNRITPLDRTVIVVDLDKQAFGAYDASGKLVHWGPVSGGQDYCPDIGRPCHSPTGIFYVQYKEGPDCFSSKYPLPDGGAPMPYCMYFHGGYAMHGCVLPGYNASHGCIRMFTEDAEWLNKNFVEFGAKTTEVIVQQEFEY
ncbi:MAG: L,D-transpeptidase [bacterium]